MQVCGSLHFWYGTVEPEDQPFDYLVRTSLDIFVYLGFLISFVCVFVGEHSGIITLILLSLCGSINYLISVIYRGIQVLVKTSLREKYLRYSYTCIYFHITVIYSCWYLSRYLMVKITAIWIVSFILMYLH